jgi:hypothetical protein
MTSNSLAKSQTPQDFNLVRGQPISYLLHEDLPPQTQALDERLKFCQINKK